MLVVISDYSMMFGEKSTDSDLIVGLFNVIIYSSGSLCWHRKPENFQHKQGDASQFKKYIYKILTS